MTSLIPQDKYRKIKHTLGEYFPNEDSGPLQFFKVSIYFLYLVSYSKWNILTISVIANKKKYIYNN